MKISNSLVILDLETTGIWIEKDRIIEIGMIRLEPDGSNARYHKRVNPEMPIPPRVTEITRIRDQDVKDAPKFAQIAEEVNEFMKDADLGGFNVERFDLPLLERQLFECGIRLEWRQRPIYDAQKIYHYFERRDLTAAYKFYCKGELVDAHSAMADTEAVVEILEGQLKRYMPDAEDLGAFVSTVKHEDIGFYGRERKFRWWNGELYPTFGKYARKKSLEEIALKDPGYLQWILRGDFTEEVKNLVQKALAGEYPTQTT